MGSIPIEGLGLTSIPLFSVVNLKHREKNMEYLKFTAFVCVLTFITMYPVFSSYYKFRKELDAKTPSEEILEMVTSNDEECNIDDAIETLESNKML